MKRPLKWIVAVVGVIVLLFVSAAILLPILIDPNDHKQALVDQVKTRTGRDLLIDGDIELSVFPWIGVEVGKIALSNAAGFADPVFASTEEVSIRVKLLPLLSRRLEMDTVTVHGLTLNLARDSTGRNNWDDLAAAGSEPGDGEAPSTPGTSEPSSGRAAAALAIGGLDIRDANLSWDDASQGQRFEVNNLSVQTGAIGAGEPVDLELALDVQVGEPAVSGHIAAEGKLDYDQMRHLARVDDLAIEGEFSGEKLKLTGELLVSDIDTAPATKGSIRIDEFNPKKLLAAFSGDALETSDPEALTAVSLEATLGGGANRLSVKPLTIRLDDATLTGEVTSPSIRSQALRFNLALDAIDVDRYLPPQKEKSGAAEPAAATPGAAATGASQVPNEALRRLDVVGQMKIGKLKAAKLNLTDVDMSITAKDGLIRLHPIGANLYNGTYRGDITVDARGDSPRTVVDENLVGVLAGPLLKDLQGHDRITGTGNIDVAMRTTGATADEVKRSLNGTANFAFTDGAINGVNVARMIREAYARIKGIKLPPEEVEQKTDFSELRGSMQVENGIATNNDFTVMTPLLRINGKGTANLPAETVDYRVRATLVTTLKGQGGEEMKDLVGIPIPIHVTGSFAEPKYALDTQALAEAVAKSKVQDVIEDKVGDDAVKGLLKGLFK
jgi:AsmA protein